jgi:mRNA interferase RelE/StbE
LAWKIEFAERPRKALRKLDRPTARRIVDTIEEIARLDDPRARGKPLTGKFAGLWRYRMGDWRVIAKLEDDRLIIIVIEIGHRSQIYRR